jgi:hypothetical protein
MKIKFQQLGSPSFLPYAENYTFIIYNEDLHKTTELRCQQGWAGDHRISEDIIGDTIEFSFEGEKK